jgi:rhamnosyltransferase
MTTDVLDTSVTELRTSVSDRTDTRNESRRSERLRSVRPATALVVPTLNPGESFKDWLEAVNRQTIQPDHRLVIDSASTDRTVSMALEAGFRVSSIRRRDFSHGGTRQWAVNSLKSTDIIVFLTQDALPANERALETLLAAFNDPQVAAAYGRQLPRHEADPIEAHARLFNYPGQSHVRSHNDIPELGIKSSFLSNSFAAWRRSALLEVGGFPRHTIQNEDAWVASKLILAGYKIAYCAEAEVFHSHGYNWQQEFKRYFDIGVFHARDPWIREKFGAAGSEGKRFVISELKHLARHGPRFIPAAFIRTGLKLLGFKLGNNEDRLPLWLKRRLTTNKTYWK